LEFDLRELKPADRGTADIWVGLITSTGKTYHLIIRDTYIGHMLSDRASTGSPVASMGLKNKATIRIQMRSRDVVVLANGTPVYGRSIDPNKEAARKPLEMTGDDVGRLSIGSTGFGGQWEISGMKLIPLN
jgi:hypothetical protein